MSQEQKHLTPIVIVTRRSLKKVDSVAQWVRQHRVHRYVAVAENPNEAYAMGMAAVLDESFAAAHKISIKKGVATCVLFSENSAPLGSRKPFLHATIYRTPAGNVAAYRSVVAATSPEMADWIARDNIVGQSSMRPIETQVFPADDGDIFYIGEADYKECRAMFHKAYMQVSETGPIKCLENLDEQVSANEWPDEKLLEALDPSVRAVLPANPSRADLLKNLLLSEVADSTASRMSDGTEEGDEINGRFIGLYTPLFFQTYSANCIGAGFAATTQERIEETRATSLLRG